MILEEACGSFRSAASDASVGDRSGGDMTDRATQPAEDPFIPLEMEHPIWDRFLTVAPLVVIGTVAPGGEANLAPKHMATPMGWSNYFGFVCTPTHGTYQHIQRDREFTVSYPRPGEVVTTALTASPRCDDGSKPMSSQLPTMPARHVAGVLLRDAYLHLECRLERLVEGFGVNSLIVGEVVAASVHRDALLRQDRDPQDVLSRAPVLAYLNPGRFVEIDESNSFPFPDGFAR
jgi:flavin reductase (DIM6/NTAB) family NADH-FMN oxidoreductase RutF